jgi:hypothetical protein
MDDTTFQSPPDLTRCVLPEKTTFSDAHYITADPDSLGSYILLHRLAAQMGDDLAVDRFRALKFICQQRDKRTPRLARVLLWGYGTCSEYGNNFARALVAVVAFNAIAFLTYLIWFHATKNVAPSLDLTSHVARFTIQQMFKPFDVLSSTTGGVTVPFFDRPPLLLTLAAIIQSVVSLSLVGVFLQSFYRYFKRN